MLASVINWLKFMHYKLDKVVFEYYLIVLNCSYIIISAIIQHKTLKTVEIITFRVKYQL